MGVMTNTIPTSTVATDQQGELGIIPSSDVSLTKDFYIKLGTNYTALKPRNGDLRLQDKDDIDDSNWIQFKVDDGLPTVQILVSKLLEILNDLQIIPSAALSKALTIRDNTNIQDNVVINEDGTIDIRLGAFPIAPLSASLGSGAFTFLNGYIQNLFITALIATGNIACDTLTVGGGYGSTGVSVDNSGNVQMNGKLTVDGAIDPTELDMPDDAPVYYDTAKTILTKYDSVSGKVKSVGTREFANPVELLDSLSLKDDKKIFLDTAQLKSIRWKTSTSEIELDDNVNITNNLKVENDVTVENNLTVDNILDWHVVECLPKIYSAAAEPDIANDSMAFWWDTNLTQMWIIIDSGGTQYKVQMA